MGKRQWKNVGEQVRLDEISGNYFLWMTVDGKPKRIKLAPKDVKYAKLDAAKLQKEYERYVSGVGKNPFAKAVTFAEVAAAYIAADCPKKTLKGRPGEFTKHETSRLEHLVKYFGKHELDNIHIRDLPAYAAWRKKRLTKSNCTGDRTVDMEQNTLSNVMGYAVMQGHINQNPVASGRPRNHEAGDISRSWDRTVKTGSMVHRLANYFFRHPRSESLGWLTIFSALTGCRNIELRGLRVDGVDKTTPGWIENNHLYIRRAKNGVSPWIELKGPLADAVECFRHWHAQRFPKGTEHESKWWFPGGRFPNGRQNQDEPVTKGALAQGLTRACQVLDLKHCSPHGFRSFYVTLRRGEGALDWQIAGEIGDRTVSVIAQSYGDPNEPGRTKLSFLPSAGEPAWDQWRPKTVVPHDFADVEETIRSLLAEG